MTPPSDRKDEDAPSKGAARLDRRDFVRVAGLGAAGLAGAVSAAGAASESPDPRAAAVLADPEWPSLRHYPQDRIARIALPLGGIGTGTVSLGGRGDLCDWEIMNRPAKGFVPTGGGASPFFALFARAADDAPVCRILEGPIESFEFEGSHGSPAPNAGLPRFRECSFAAAYPFGRVTLRDAEVPLEVELKAFNPLVPTEAETSGIPVAVLTYELRNPGARPVEASICGTLPNFVGMDGFETRRDWKGDTQPTGASKNRNVFRQGPTYRGVFFDTEGVEARSAAWGTMALVTTATEGVTHRTSWAKREWGFPILDFWDDFSADGRLDEREKPEGLDSPVGSLAVALEVPPGATRTRSPSSSPGTSPTGTPGPPGTPTTTSSATTTRRCTATPGTWRGRRCRASTHCSGAPPASSPPCAGATSRGGQGGGAVQRQHAAHPDLLPDPRRPVLRVGGLRQRAGVLPRVVHPRVELRAGHAVPLRRAGARPCARWSSASPPPTTG